MIFSSHKKERAFAHLWQLDSPLNKGLCFFKTQHHPPLARLHTQGSAWLLWHAVLVSDLQVLCWWSVSNTIKVSKSPWGPLLLTSPALLAAGMLLSWVHGLHLFSVSAHPQMLPLILSTLNIIPEMIFFLAGANLGSLSYGLCYFALTQPVAI